MKANTGKTKAVDSDKSIRLMLGYLCISNEVDVNLKRKVQILDRFEISDAEIALICDCSTQSVMNARSLAKKKVKSQKK